MALRLQALRDDEARRDEPAEVDLDGLRSEGGIGLEGLLRAEDADRRVDQVDVTHLVEQVAQHLGVAVDVGGVPVAHVDGRAGRREVLGHGLHAVFGPTREHHAGGATFDEPQAERPADVGAAPEHQYGLNFSECVLHVVLPSGAGPVAAGGRSTARSGRDVTCRPEAASASSGGVALRCGP